MFRIMIRNLSASINKNIPICLIIFSIGLILFVSNSIFEASEGGLRRSYQETFSGEVVISQNSFEPFNLFGSETPLIGEYLIPPVIQDYEKLLALIGSDTRVKNYVSQVSSVAQTNLSGKTSLQPLFGVDFSLYSKSFPNIEFMIGSWPATNQDLTILISENFYNDLNKLLNTTIEIGQIFIVSGMNNGTFNIRELKLGGVFRIPSSDAFLDRLAFVSPVITRSFNGYVYGTDQNWEEADIENSVFSSDIDDLFSDVMSNTESSTESYSLDDLEKSFSNFDDFSIYQSSDQSAWNNVIIRLNPEVDVESFISDWKNLVKEHNFPWVVRDWRGAVGGNAQLVWLLRILLNAGLLFVAFGALTIIINALGLSIMERKKEIGTMRALGASKRKVALIIGGESFLVIFVSGTLGVFSGLLLSIWLGALGIHLDNPLIRSLFGGSVLITTVSWKLLLSHVVVMMSMAFTVVIYPIHKALDLNPLMALGAE